MSRLILSTVALASLTTAMAHAEGDATLGKRQFAPCTSCHTIEAVGAAKIGPNLHGVVGKKAATSHADFAYSDALKKSGLTWNEETLEKWLAKPMDLVPGTKMSFLGVPKEEVRENIIAYLKEESK